MIAYRTIRFTEGPDVGDIKAEGRASRVGRLDRRTYNAPRVKAATRRYLKRVDRRNIDRFNTRAEAI